MTECNGCGGCCDPVVLPYTQTEAATVWRDQHQAADLRWIMEDLTPMRPREALGKEPRLFAELKGVQGPQPGDFGWFYYSCRHFDVQTRQCGNYQARPPACRRFPWPQGQPQQGTPLPAACSFNADIGRPVELRRT